MGDMGYFGLKLGEAISSGAGHISQALQRKYELQRQADKEQEERARQEEARDQQAQMTFAAQGIDYDPANPAIAFSKFAETMAARKSREQGIAGEDRELARRKTEAQIREMERTPNARQMTPPPGYRFLPDGTLEAIPGGPAAMSIQEKQTERDEDIARKESASSSQMSGASKVLRNIDEALDTIGWRSTGWGGALFQKLPNSEARSLKNLLDPIQANIGFDRLTQMRNESKTGGALGQVSERELKLLTSTIAPLDPLDKDFKNNLQFVKEHYQRFVTALKDYSNMSDEQMYADLAANGFSSQEANELVARRQ